MNSKTSYAQSDGVAIGGDAQDNVIITGDIGGDVTVIKQARAIEPTPLHQIQPPPRDFTGREAEIKELMELLEHGGVTISGLQGLGGVGKTTLALKLAEALKDKYPDAQFYLDLKGADAKPLPVADALAHVIRAYHPTAKLPESVDELRALYLSVLHNQKALLLMDNARDEQQVEPLIPPPGCLLLVTSRFHFTVPGLKVKNLDALLPEDAVKLLLEIAPRIADQAAEIARLCGNLPLGLRLAASFLSTRANYKVAEYVRKLADASERLKLIDASLSLSYELLREEMQTNWRALAVFPDSFDQRAAAAVWDLDKEQTQERLGDLFAFSLVEYSEETDRYHLHDLARVFADSRLIEAERLTYHQRHAEHYLQTLTESQKLYEQGGNTIKQGLALYDQEWNNIQVGWEWGIRHADTIFRALELCSNYPNQCAEIGEFRQHPRDYIAWQKIGLSAAQKLGRKGWQSAHSGNLGSAYRNVGEYQKAIQFDMQSLFIAREIGDRKGEGQTLGNIGESHRLLGEPQRAIEFYKQAISIAREVRNLRGEGNVLNNLGVAYKSLGNTERAIKYFEQSLSIARVTGDRRGEGQTLSNLGAIYRGLGDIQRAKEFFEQALSICREFDDHGNEATALWNMAVVFNDLGERAQAITYAAASLVLYKQVESPNASYVHEILESWRSE